MITQSVKVKHQVHRTAARRTGLSILLPVPERKLLSPAQDGKFSRAIRTKPGRTLCIQGTVQMPIRTDCGPAPEWISVVC